MSLSLYYHYKGLAMPLSKTTGAKGLLLPQIKGAIGLLNGVVLRTIKPDHIIKPLIQSSSMERTFNQSTLRHPSTKSCLSTTTQTPNRSSALSTHPQKP